MSEYPYYEFQAIDRRLTGAEMQTPRTCSTRAQITPTSFVNEYHWGDCKGEPDAWMESYFDASFTSQIAARASSSFGSPPASSIRKIVRAYRDGNSSSVRQKGDHLILTFQSELEGGDDSYDLEGGGLLASMVPLRAERAQGDRRALYLAWLAFMRASDLDDDAIEPPVPPGLGELSGSLDALINFLRVDPDLLEIAAQASAPRAASPLQRNEVAGWVAALAPTEKDEILTRLIVAPDDIASVPAELLHRFFRAREVSRSSPSQSHDSRRTVGELLRATGARTAQPEQAPARKEFKEKARLEREAAAARARHLDRLAGQEPQL